MGITQMGPPVDFVLFLKENFRIQQFIETGTYQGNTAIWASEHFDSVISVEDSQVIYQELLRNHPDIPKIRFIIGDSVTFLADRVRELNESAVFWIDSHWCGEESYGENDQCPLLLEIAELNKSPRPQFILIDDARLFLFPPPAPN